MSSLLSRIALAANPARQLALRRALHTSAPAMSSAVSTHAHGTEPSAADLEWARQALKEDDEIQQRAFQIFYDEVAKQPDEPAAGGDHHDEHHGEHHKHTAFNYGMSGKWWGPMLFITALWPGVWVILDFRRKQYEGKFYK